MKKITTFAKKINDNGPSSTYTFAGREPDGRVQNLFQ
jgi:hypothetical protein